MIRIKRLISFIALALALCAILSSCLNSGEQTEATTDNEGESTMSTEHTHVFGEWHTVRDATCTEDGLEERACACKETEQRSIGRLGHTEPDENGKCTRCNTYLPYNFPMNQATRLDGTILTKTNKYEIVDGYYGAVIDLQAVPIPFNTVTITRLETASQMGYSFLRELPVQSQIPSYASGYTCVIWDTSREATIDVPSDARYLYVYYSDRGDVMFLPQAVAFLTVEKTEGPRSFTVATWNIGHFSMGKHKSSSIADGDYATEKPNYTTYIDGSVGADIIALAEYSEQFTSSHPANELFGSYTAASFEGAQRRYSCNAVYSKLPLSNITVHEFECNRDAVITYTNAVKAPDYYYITADLTFEGETITIVALHLAYDDNLYDVPPYIDTVCLNQMDELIAAFADTERVIMLGDWNAYSPDYFNRFANAGYTVGNDGSILTCTGSKTGGLEWSVDNIIVKGLSISDFRKVPTGLSDHVAVTATITLE